ncbi:MAG: lipid-A-disaccharide synthase [Acidobacteria bacterium]|nr:MAG: lipid-A-disaccharide synthase [Acidobacteriota bacterium]
MSATTARRVLISAGEASGENYGAMLIPELRKLLGTETQFFGVGGEKMRAAGCETIIDSGKVAAVGITEVMKHVATIYREFFRMVSVARSRKPDVAVLIDFPDFNLRLAEKLHTMGVPVVYFVSPQLWAWKQRRIWRVKKFVDRMLVIFPFEESYYRERRVDAEYVGHPLADLPLPQIAREEFARRFGIEGGKKWIALLPGSRKKEILLNLPVMLQAAGELGPEYEYLVPVASTLSRDWMAQQTGGARVHLVDDPCAALLHSRAAVVASGTATVEAALIGTPFIVVYRVSGLSYAIGRRLVKVKNFGMVNLIAGREIVPELIQSNFRPENVVRQIRRLLVEGDPRAEMVRNLEGVRKELRNAADARGKTAIVRAAEAIGRTLLNSQPVKQKAT